MNVIESTATVQISTSGYSDRYVTTINWKISECDRVNIERHGFANRWEGVWDQEKSKK